MPRGWNRRSGVLSPKEDPWLPEGPTATDNPVSVYYPFALVEFVEVLEDDENRAAGEVLLVFRDQDGCRVTVRLRKAALERLLAACARPIP